MLALLLILLIRAAPSAQLRDAWSVARAIESHYRRAQSLKAVFLETYRAGADDVRLESGTVYFQRPGRMRWDYQSPSAKLFLIDGRNVWFYIPTDHTASRSPVRESEDWRTPFALLTGKAHFKDLCRRLALVPSEGGPGSPPAGDTVLDCIPRGAARGENGILDALIEVDSSDRLVRVTVRQAADVTTEVRFGNWQENLPLPKSLFEFEPPPGVSVIGQPPAPGR
ncbi:MAG TPA: outer membrane lipoprotein carrier protein LolA [Candidatus Acidoferrales bacterium]|nr:outer membrane lipoprotein carrier protein LolA [Candidatus Acidoferrales bacterium]